MWNATDARMLAQDCPLVAITASLALLRCSMALELTLPDHVAGLAKQARPRTPEMPTNFYVC